MTDEDLSTLIAEIPSHESSIKNARRDLKAASSHEEASLKEYELDRKSTVSFQEKLRIATEKYNGLMDQLKIEMVRRYQLENPISPDLDIDEPGLDFGSRTRDV